MSTATKTKSEITAQLNVKARHNLTNYHMTNGVRSLDGQSLEKLIKLVKEFNQFDPENDPYGEHDFGSVEFEGVKYFFKIDYYAKGSNFQLGSEDPSNESITTRIITLMRADEY